MTGWLIWRKHYIRTTVGQLWSLLNVRGSEINTSLHVWIHPLVLGNVGYIQKCSHPALQYSKLVKVPTSTCIAFHAGIWEHIPMNVIPVGKKSISIPFLLISIRRLYVTLFLSCNTHWMYWGNAMDHLALGGVLSRLSCPIDSDRTPHSAACAGTSTLVTFVLFIPSSVWNMLLSRNCTARLLVILW